MTNREQRTEISLKMNAYLGTDCNCVVLAYNFLLLMLLGLW